MDSIIKDTTDYHISLLKIILILIGKDIDLTRNYKIIELNDIFNKLNKKELNVIILHKNHDIFIQEDEDEEEEFDFNNTIKPLTKIEKEADGDEEEEEFDDKNTIKPVKVRNEDEEDQKVRNIEDEEDEENISNGDEESVKVSDGDEEEEVSNGDEENISNGNDESVKVSDGDEEEEVSNGDEENISNGNEKSVKVRNIENEEEENISNGDEESVKVSDGNEESVKVSDGDDEEEEDKFYKLLIEIRKNLLNIHILINPSTLDKFKNYFHELKSYSNINDLIIFTKNLNYKKYTAIFFYLFNDDDDIFIDNELENLLLNYFSDIDTIHDIEKKALNFLKLLNELFILLKKEYIESSLKKIEKIEKIEKITKIEKKTKKTKISSIIVEIKNIILQKPENITLLYHKMKLFKMIYIIINKPIYYDIQFEDLINGLINDLFNENKSYNEILVLIVSYEKYKTNIFSIIFNYDEIIELFNSNAIFDHSSNFINNIYYRNIINFIYKFISFIYSLKIEKFSFNLLSPNKKTSLDDFIISARIYKYILTIIKKNSYKIYNIDIALNSNNEIIMISYNDNTLTNFYNFKIDSNYLLSIYNILLQFKTFNMSITNVKLNTIDQYKLFTNNIKKFFNIPLN